MATISVQPDVRDQCDLAARETVAVMGASGSCGDEPNRFKFFVSCPERTALGVRLEPLQPLLIRLRDRCVALMWKQYQPDASDASTIMEFIETRILFEELMSISDDIDDDRTFAAYH